eukprot:m.113522 g.113522  ORF g.113522 m.113522 type:complete len:800 (+) comp17087_c0_seq5:262-2661(+)
MQRNNIFFQLLVMWYAYASAFSNGKRSPDYICAPGNPGANLPFCNTSMSFEARAADVVRRIPIHQAGALLSTSSIGIPSLGVPAVQWWSEGLHGVRCGHSISNCDAGTTIYPEPIGTAAAFNESLWYAIGDAVATEFRVFNNNQHGYLSIFAPNINIFRDGRWGRGQETPGEDPYLTSRYAVNWVQGMQGNASTKYYKTITTCKHFAAYDIENYNQANLSGSTAMRQNFNAIVSAQDLADTFFPAFKACVSDGRGAAVMCSYNAVNGQASCGNRFLQETVLRGQLNFTGYIVSDCGGVADIENPRYPSQASCIANVNGRVHNDNSSSCFLHSNFNGSTVVGMGMNGGCDMDCGDVYAHGLQKSVQSGEVGGARITQALQRLFLARMRLGDFDSPEVQPYRQISNAELNSKKHQELALDAARQSLTLLKNNKGTLPLDLTHKTVATIGASANCSILQSKAPGVCMQLGNYATAAPFTITLTQGIQQLNQADSVTFDQGCAYHGSDRSGFAAAVASARIADVTVLVLGLAIGRDWSTNQESWQEGEADDRLSVALPAIQQELLDEIASATDATKRKLVVIMMNGGPIDISAMKMDDAILRSMSCAWTCVQMPAMAIPVALIASTTALTLLFMNSAMGSTITGAESSTPGSTRMLKLFTHHWLSLRQCGSRQCCLTFTTYGISTSMWMWTPQATSLTSMLVHCCRRAAKSLPVTPWLSLARRSSIHRLQRVSWRTSHRQTLVSMDVRCASSLLFKRCGLHQGSTKKSLSRPRRITLLLSTRRETELHQTASGCCGLATCTRV